MLCLPSYLAYGQSGLMAPPAFDAASAYQLLQKQCRFGPRVPGTKAHQECGEFLFSYLHNLSSSTGKQPFTVDSANNPIEMLNIIASFDLMRQSRILLCAHWDSRPRADKENDPARRKEPISGANDGASGVAVLLEMARLISNNPPESGVTIALFDGEDWGEEDRLDDYFLGSKYFAARLKPPLPDYAILLDMIGDKNLEIYMEQNSYAANPSLVEAIWSRAASLGLKAFVPEVKYQVWDDHLPLIRAGIPSVDIIDLDYPYWHTLGDSPDKCSPESLKQVGDLLVSILYDPLKTY